MSATSLRAIGVGCAKTGTKSLAAMFRDHYRSAHEPQAHALIDLILEQKNMARPEFREAVRGLLDPLDLEMNASQLNGYIIRTMVVLYPGAKFILTLRDPKAWLRSFANHQTTRGEPSPDSPWSRFRDLRFLGEGRSDGRGYYTIDQYLAYWLAHNLKVIRAVPREHLLVVRTENLSLEIPRLAAFLNVPEDTIVPMRENSGGYQGASPLSFDDEELTKLANHYAARLRKITGIDI